MADLKTYRRKRDFTKTLEPRGRVSTARSRGDRAGGAFVIQKHAARRLHYDFRLEIDGVLKSWAVPKGPSLDPGVRRLAMHVEDHPLDYGDFEGSIPAGEYGGGTVMLWDSGRWEPLEDAREGYRRGELKVRLDGRRLRGAWALVRMRPRQAADDDDAAERWLLIKERDEHARPGAPDAWGEDDRSVTSGRTMREIAAGVEVEPRHAGARRRDPGRAGKREASLPATTTPTLATLVEQPPEGDDWIHEVKYDGYRILARIQDGAVRLLTRNGVDWTARFPAIAGELARLKTDATVLDGEVVVLDGEGVSDFGALQRAVGDATDVDAVYMTFDLLYQDGADVRDLPLVARKQRLARLLKGRRRRSAGLVRLSEHVTGSGGEFFSAACAHKLEGVVSKRADSSYSGRRTSAWLKSKCGDRQEVVVVGYTDAAGSRTGFGALLVGVQRAEGGITYAGKVGAGFRDDDLKRLASRLRALRRETPPIEGASKLRGAHWVTPRIVIEAAFAGWTAAGRLRQPVFKGVREDKPEDEVRREVPRSQTALASRRSAEVAGVRISHPERVVYAAGTMTKLDVARYYEAVAEHMLPHLAGRPLTVVRCPEGPGEACFFQKHVTESIPDRIARVTVRESKGTAEYPVIDGLAALITMVQLGALEFHIWGSREDHLEQPDRVIFDLDPAEEVEWRAVRAAARELREELRGRGLESLLMTSGGKGLHVVVPVRPSASWEAVGAFARDVAESLVAREPHRYVAAMSKARRTGKVFIDHFRNGRGATAVAPYSLRARENPSVATPIEWDELGRVSGAAVWTAPRVLRRLRVRGRDPWPESAALGRDAGQSL